MIHRKIYRLKKGFGFTLIELMTVIAIISILASVAIPNLIKFQSRAKQTEAKTNLKAAYLAAKTRFAEISDYRMIYLFAKPTGAPGVISPLDFEKNTVYRYRANGLYPSSLDQYICTKPSCWPSSGYYTGSACNYNAINPTMTTFVYKAFGQIDYDLYIDVWTIDSNNLLVNSSMSAPGTYSGGPESCNDSIYQ